MHLDQDSDNDYISEILARFKRLVAQDTTGTRMVVVTYNELQILHDHKMVKQRWFKDGWWHTHQVVGGNGRPRKVKTRVVVVSHFSHLPGDVPEGSV